MYYRLLFTNVEQNGVDINCFMTAVGPVLALIGLRSFSALRPLNAGLLDKVSMKNVIVFIITIGV